MWFLTFLTLCASCLFYSMNCVVLKWSYKPVVIMEVTISRFLLSHSQNCTIKCACLTSHYEGASSAQSKTEATGLKRVWERVSVSVRLSACLPFVYWANAHVWVCQVVCTCRVSAVWICWCVTLLSGWMSEGELGVGGWDKIQSMDLEIPQDHPVMLLN